MVEKSENLPNLKKEEKKLQTEGEGSDNIDWNKRNKIFKIFLYVVIFTNFDTGVIPACVTNIEEEMGIGSFEISVLGSLPFFAISLASLMVSFVIEKFKSKATLLTALICNIFVCFIFALTSNLGLLYCMRFMMGFTQAFWVIYAPVWTNRSSPIKSQTTWIGLLQGFSPLGIILGYICTGIVIENWTSIYSWRAVIVFQGIFEIPIVILLLFMDGKDIEIDDARKRAGSINETNENLPEIENDVEEVTLNQATQIFKHYKVLLSNGLYLNAVLTLTIAFFVVYGIQFWSTAYIEQIFEIDASTAIIIYACLTVTSPIAGVFLGGYFSDKMGGYKGDNMIKSIKICLAFNVISMFIGIPTGFVFKIYFWAPLIWTQIFFGSSNVPAATGIVVNSVPKEYQTSASALAQLIYNMFAYFASPIFSGFVMELFSDSKTGMLWGYRANEFVGLLGILFSSLCLYYGKKIQKERAEKGIVEPPVSYRRSFRQRAWSII